MKAVLFLALVGAAAATEIPIGTQYMTNPSKNTGGTCVLAEGYAFAFFGGTTSLGASAIKAADGSPAGPVFKGTTTGSCTWSIAQDNDIIALTCATGYTASSCPNNLVGGTFFDTTAKIRPTGCFAAGQGAGTAFLAAYSANTISTSIPQSFGTAGTFKCTKTVVPAANTTGCNISCSGTTCATAIPATVADGDSLTASQLCATGTFVSSSTIKAGTDGKYVCTGGATNSIVWTVVCSGTPSSTMTQAQWLAYAAANGGYSQPSTSSRCNCVPTTTATTTFPTLGTAPNQYIVGPCVFTPCSATRSERQNTASAGVLCPATYTTPAQIAQCFEAAACAGKVTPLDKCIYGQTSTGTQLSTDCPACSESKKGLLGLLGLLGLIPLLLCSLLLCCLLLCIRRKKAEREVHFATFDAGAPNCDMPVVHNTSAVHHNTYVGAPHVAGPVACY